MRGAMVVVAAVMDVMFVGTARPEEIEGNIDGRRGVRDVNVLENRD